MRRSILFFTLVSVTAVLSAHATGMATIIANVSSNCDKIESFSADAIVRYVI
jgi:outer membrane lipoprotein-sorting protein